MILGSHNSWSYLPSKKWWLTPFKFMSKCQDVDIVTQYFKYGVRCFDLRIKFDKNNNPIIAHGAMIYKYSENNLYEDLSFINSVGGIVRILHEVRSKKEYTLTSRKHFINFVIKLQHTYPNIKFWCGRNLYNWEIDYEFSYKPTCEEKYSSVCKPRLIDDWYPRLFAFRNNKKIKKVGTDKDILLIDFVNYG